MTTVWITKAQTEQHTFDPLVFSVAPVYATGTTEGVWRPKAKQAEVWIPENLDIRVFSPLVFSLKPVFATGTTAGVWIVEAAA